MAFAILQLLRKLLKALTDTHMKFIWKAYYKYRLGDSYESVLANSRSLNRAVNEMTIGRMHTFYDMQGNRIRGFDNRKVKTKKSDVHPLMEKYGKH